MSVKQRIYYWATCDECGRRQGDIDCEGTELSTSKAEAIRTWSDNDLGPMPAPSGKALCWDCAEKIEVALGGGQS